MISSSSGQFDFTQSKVLENAFWIPFQWRTIIATTRPMPSVMIVKVMSCQFFLNQPTKPQNTFLTKPQVAAQIVWKNLVLVAR